MAFDLRQVMAAFLTFSMFVMLGNMIKRDHIDPLLGPLQVYQNAQFDAVKISISKPSMLKLTDINYGPWGLNSDPATPCWKKPLSKGKVNPNNGYIFFSLTRGPEFHASQIANAVVVARHLGATLAIPDIRGNKLGDKRHFGEIYDVNRFMTSLNGVVQVDKNPPAGLANGRLHIVRVPSRVSKDFIASKIEPIFQSKRNLRIITDFNSSTMNNGKADKLSNAYQCLAMFESLKLQADLQELVDSMVGTLRSLSQKMRGHFVAVDLRAEMLEKKGCQETNAGGKWCYNAEQIGKFLQKIGFHKDTTIYLTQTGWSSSLNPLRDAFPNTFTKDAIIPADEKAELMNSGYDKFVDFYMCIKGDVFVPAFPSRFYGSIVGKRIGDSNTQIFLPWKNASDSAAEYMSKKSHFAYSCFC